jgi:hypothetical protein
MFEIEVTFLAQEQMTLALEVPDHFFERVAMFADQQVNVIGHDRAGVAGVLALSDHSPERSGDAIAMLVRDRNARESKDIFGCSEVISDLPRLGLFRLATMVQFSNSIEHV